MTATRPDRSNSFLRLVKLCQLFTPVRPDQAMEIAVDALTVAEEGSALIVTEGSEGPQITESPYAWDGTDFLVQGVSWSARSDNIRRSSHVALVLRDPFEAVTLVVYGEAALREGTDAEQVLIVVRPNRVHRLSSTGRAAP
jgi:hypothetical protein